MRRHALGTGPARLQHTAPLRAARRPPPQALLAYSTAMVRSNPSLCSVPLATHPLSQQRLQQFHKGMHLASMVLPGALCMRPGLAAGRWRGRAALRPRGVP